MSTLSRIIVWDARRYLAAAALVVLTATGASAQAVQPTAAATDLVTYLAVSGQNVYGSNPSYITWAGTASAARTVCSTFITNLWKHTFGWTDATFKAWTGSSSPNAGLFHDTIAVQNGFTRIDTVADMAAGDLIAIRYPAGEATTGHVAMLASTPTPRVATSPIVAGTTQYEAVVFDSSASGHGTGDTRYRAATKSFTGGIGKGTMRLYVDANGFIVGHTWSTFGNSDYYTQADHHLVVGRLNQ